MRICKECLERDYSNAEAFVKEGIDETNICEICRNEKEIMIIHESWLKLK